MLVKSSAYVFAKIRMKKITQAIYIAYILHCVSANVFCVLYNVSNRTKFSQHQEETCIIVSYVLDAYADWNKHWSSQIFQF